MENTLDSIRPSENPQEMSYLFGRDPSILAYSQRPFPSKDTKKNLLSLYEVEEDNFTNENESEHSESQTTFQTIKVYLRLKPFPKKLKLTEEQQEAYRITNSTTLLTKLPMLDNNGSSKQSKSSEIICRKFTFSQTFGPEITQLELFEKTVQQQMIDFLAGQNCTIMTYGTTNSGKSYTLQGTTTSPGLIPRALEFVFNNITTRPSPFYKPLHYSDVVNLNALERAQELEAKTKLLTFSSVDKHQYMNTYKQMQKLLQEESIRPSQCHDAHYSVWVSFAEIYNEIVYDLLSSECQKKRIPLKLGADSNGRAFIRGLKTIYVNSAAEAYQILMAGQYNLKVAATALNAKSSRSHCIFTIILLKYYAENLPDTVEISTFSFCDLAGSERLKKTLNIGDRLKEAQNINTSLLVLGRCLKSIHEGQLTRTKTDAVGPFRESKLTRLFQRSLSGKEHLALIVNVNPLPNLYVETQNVLNFAAIAKKIVIERKKQIQKKLKSRFSQIVTQSIQTVTDWDTTELESVDWQPTNSVEDNSGYITSEEYMDLANENEKLKKEIALLKNSALIRDFQSRQEMAEKYIAMINELEIDWKQRINDVETQHEDVLEWTVKQVEEFYKGKLNQLHRKRKRRSDCSDDSDEDDGNLNLTIKELVKENTQLREKNETLKKTLTDLKVTNETLIVEKNKATFELGLSKEDLKVARNLLETAQKDICSTEDGKVYIKEMTSQLLVKDEQIKKLKEILNEAKEEYITTMSDLKKNELCIDEQAKIIVENEEKIEDLELHLEHVNVCLTEKTAIVELLEEKLEHQNENKILQLQEEINKLKNEKLALIKSCEEELTLKTSVQNEYQEIIIKEEMITGEISEDSSKITENMEEKIENAKISINEIKETNSNNLILTENLFSKQILVDTGCQVDITNDEDYDIKNKLEESTQVTVTITTSEDIQTSNKMSVLKEEAVQTDDIANDDAKLQLNALTVQFNDIQRQYVHKCLQVEQLTEQLNDMKETLHTLKEEKHLTKAIVDEYKNSAEVLKKQLTLTAEEKQKIEETLLSSNMAFKQKIVDYEYKINQLEKNLSIAKDNAQQYLEKLETTKKELDNYTLKCKQETEIDVCKSDKFVSVKKEDNDVNDISVNQLDKYEEKISHLENSLETIEKLKHNIDQLNENLKTCQVEKNCIQKALNENNEKLLELESRLKETTLKEQEKDTEIVTLQKELKRMIQKSENAERTDDMMEAELKSAINELTQTKEMLLQKEQHIKELKIHLQNSERNTKIFNLLEQNAKERQVENERLRNINDELRTNLTQKEREMDAFMKNRDETVTKYEALVKNQQEELDMQKREVMRYQELFRRQITPTPNKDDYKKLQSRIEVLQDKLQKYEVNAKTKNDYDSTSEEEVLAQRQPKRRGKKTVLSAKQENIPVIELSGSESKRNTRQATLPPPDASTEKRCTRRKKLFNENDSFADVEPAATILPTRNLRNRKK